ncbi:hypothetical protein DRQ25_16250, partial [Candidatus Fermentibacteria bacterium]
GNLDGLIGADAICQSHADEANLTGTYMAWLSDDTQNTQSRLNHSSVPYILPSGTVIADNWTELISGTLQHNINETENGTIVTDDVELAWTFTDSTGLQPTDQMTYRNNCHNWTVDTHPTQQVYGVVGYIHGQAWQPFGKWTYGNSTKCFNEQRLYCIEQ